MTLKEAVERLKAMIEDKGDTWDLSRNDTKAIKLVLERLSLLEQLKENDKNY